jgi:hypothetical protein
VGETTLKTQWIETTIKTPLCLWMVGQKVENEGIEGFFDFLLAA